MRLAIALASVIVAVTALTSTAAADPLLDEAAARVGRASGQYAMLASICDVAAPGMWGRARRDLRDAMGSLWNEERERDIEELRNSDRVRQEMQRWRDGIAGGDFEVRDLAQACEEDFVVKRQALADAVARFNFLARTAPSSQ